MRICHFLGVEYSEKMILFYLNNNEPTDFLQWKLKTKKPVQKSNMEKFKKILSKSEIKNFETIAEKYLKFYGYKI